MICDNLKYWKQNLDYLPQMLKKALIWVEEHLNSSPIPGKYPIEDDLYVIVQKYIPKEWDNADFENHHKFVDIQIIVEGSECILWTKPQSLKNSKLYSEEKDVELFTPDFNKEYTCLKMDQGSFAIFWPSDWHMPSLQPYRTIKGNQKFSEVLKFVVKVPLGKI